jgi:hypothetical protein
MTYAPKNRSVNQQTYNSWTMNRRKVYTRLLGNVVDITYTRVQAVLFFPQPSGENVN